MALKILLADDSMTAQNMGKKILVDAGYDVIAVSNGAAAIKKVASERPDIAILDVYMPGYTGLEVCERVKAAGETAKTPVLLTVGKMEAFNPEDVSRVKADGVMIKPFEASDLIAAVQSIAQRLLAPAPPPRGIDHTVQLRTPPGQTIEDTIKMTKPAPPSHEDTLRIPPPKPGADSHEETIRLTAQEIKAFQDASYHDWKNNAEPHLEADEKAELERAAAERLAVERRAAERAAAELAAQEGFVTPEIEEPRSAPAMSMASASDGPEESAAMLLEPASDTPAISVFTAASAPFEAPVAAFDVAPEAPAYYTPPVEAPDAGPVFAVQPEAVQANRAAAESVTSSLYSEAAMSPMTPALEAIVEAVGHSSVMEVPPAIESKAVETPALETNAPLTPGPMPVAPAAELELTSMPAIEVSAAPASGLEVTSPVFEPGLQVSQDPALVTETDDMSQFVTKFGVEGAEPVHVGMASDLSDEQLRAITSPMPQEAEQLVAEAASTYSAPNSVTPAVEPGALETEAAQPETVAASPVLEQVGSFQAVAPIESVEPVVAYVPEIEDSQSFPAVRVPDPALVGASPVTFASPYEPTVAGPSMTASAPAELAAEPVAQTTIAPAETAPEPAIAEAAAVEPPAVIAVSEATETPVPAELAPSPEHVAVVHAVETALAAAAGTAVAGIAHLAHEPELAPIHDTPPYSEEVAPHHEPVGDAALAEELAAAISNKAAEEHVQAAALKAQAAPEPVGRISDSSLSDGRLAEAVARAFESLKPQLINEIMKELAR